MGEKAPDFTALATSENQAKEVKLSDYRGKKVILYFYPKDNTPFCTQQAQSLQAKYSELTTRGYVVLGVSKDSIEDHQQFIKQHGLSFLLISDKKGELHEKYGTWCKKYLIFGYTERVTFIIDEEGIIKEVITDIEYKKHAEQIIAHDDQK